MSERILVVDDEKLIRMSLRAMLEQEGYEVREAEDGAAADVQLRDDLAIDLVLLDYRLPDTTGLDILRKLKHDRPDTGAILITAHSSIDNAVEAIKLGAYDYLNKPVHRDDLLATVAKALETTRLRREVNRLRAEQRKTSGVANLVGKSRAMNDVLVLIRKIAASPAATVLIQGESGTGKDLVAKAIHFSSDRTDRPFMNITCSALPETLLESELFGHERGAFTDARQLKKGLLELADGGSVFLDEIGEMTLTLQSKLLRFLEEKQFRRVGGAKDLRVDVRVIAATNVDLERAVKQGAFREDLYYRLKVVPIYLPSLRERRDDIPLLVDHFVQQFNVEFRKSTERVTPEAMELLRRYDWPGNIRELRNVVERTMILENKAVLDVEDLPEEILPAGDDDGDEEDGEHEAPSASSRIAIPGATTTAATASEAVVLLPDGGVALKEVERSLLAQALERTAGNQSKAARLLRISRDALRYKAKKFGLEG